MNPNDTEEAIWAFLCGAQLVGAAEARRSFLTVTFTATYPADGKWQSFSTQGCTCTGLPDTASVRMILVTLEFYDSLQVGRDPRPVMRAAYSVFRSGESPEAIISAAGPDQSGHDRFYALLVCPPATAQL